MLVEKSPFFCTFAADRASFITSEKTFYYEREYVAAFPSFRFLFSGD